MDWTEELPEASDTSGYYQGRHYTEWVSDVQLLERSGDLAAAEQLLLGLVEAVERESRAKKWGVAPWYYERLAIDYRKLGRIDDEISILERYCAQQSAPGASASILGERLAKARAIRAARTAADGTLIINPTPTPQPRAPRRVKTPAETAQAWLGKDPLFLDTETTGLGEHDEVVQIAVVDKFGNSVFESLVKPKKHIPMRASEIHGICDEDVESAPTGAQVIEQLRPILEGRLVCIYNASFDVRLLEQTARKWKKELPSFKSRCVMKLHAKYANEIDERYGTPRWWKLEDLAAMYRLGEFNAHDALNDAQMTARVLHYIAHDGKLWFAKDGTATTDPPARSVAKAARSAVVAAPVAVKFGGCLLPLLGGGGVLLAILSLM